MKKRILIAAYYLEIGGAESSLIGMLQAFDYSKVAVDLFLYSHQGAFMNLIPKEVHLLDEIPEYTFICKEATACFKFGYWKIGFAKLLVRLCLGIYSKLKRPKTYSAWFTFTGAILTHVLPDFGRQEGYDLAISFVAPHNFILDHVKATRKVGWIHTDYSTIDVYQGLESYAWRRLDHPISISSAVTEAFVRVFPNEKEKIVEIENILSPSFVRRRAAEFVPKEYAPSRESGEVVLCTAGRLCIPKNYQNFPYMLRRLVDLGCKFHWYVIGPGNPEEYLLKARDFGVEDKISFLGGKTNPYPYIANCDLYVQPSLWEGKSVAVREAQILKRPVVITNFGTASSQVLDGVDGIIVPIDNEKIAEGVFALAQNAHQQRAIVEYLSAHDYGNEKEIKKIYALIDE